MSRKILVPLSLLALCVAVPCAAQEAQQNLRRDQPVHTTHVPESLGAVIPTPEMWFYYQQWKRHDNPRLAIRRRAEERAQDRHDRMASQQWYGIDNARPTVSGTWPGGYSPYWGSNTNDPMRWRAVNAPLVVVRPADVAR
jgi:hypothetical protein